MDDPRVQNRSRQAKPSRNDNTSWIPAAKEDPGVSFDNNDEALIDNPLLYWKPTEVEGKIRQFASFHELDNQLDVLVKGAKILGDPEAWKSVPRLTEDEKAALANEQDKGFWAQPKELKVTIITLCVAAIVQGWNQTASNGANLSWPIDLGLTHFSGCSPTGTDAWIFAVVNASTYLSAALIGCWLSDPLNEYLFGRRAAIGISAIVILASAVGGAFTQTWQELLACRILLGIGMGAKASVVPIFAAEVAPAHIRGSLVMNWQIFDAVGIFLGFTANIIASRVGRTAWRWQIASSMLPTLVLLSVIWVCPESPRFQMKHGDYRAAYRTLLALRGEPVLAAKEVLYVHYQMDVEMRQLGQKKDDVEINLGAKEAFMADGTPSLRRRVTDRIAGHRRHSINYWQKLAQLFTIKRVRRAMVAAAVVMLAQQLCGTNVLQFYSSTFFCDANGNHSAVLQDNNRFLKPLFFSWGIGLSNFIFAFPAYWLIDKRGRRWLLLVTLPFLAITMLASGLSFLIHGDHSSARLAVITVFIYIFQFFYSWGVGPVPFTLSAEVFPLENRVVGMSLAVFVNLFGAGLLTLFVPALTNRLSHVGLLGLFAGLNVIAFVLVFFFVPETAGAAVGGKPGPMTFVSLEELNYIFSVPTGRHASYQLREVMPWAWRRYIKRDPNCEKQPPKLYKWARANRDEHEELEEHSDSHTQGEDDAVRR